MLPEHERDAILRHMLPEQRERMGRMSGWARRMILAYADRRPDDLDVVLLGLEGWDDTTASSGGEAKYAFAMREIERQTNQWDDVARMRGMRIPPDFDTLRAMVAEVTPERYRNEALTKIVATPGKPDVLTVTGRELPDLCVAAATASELLTNTKLFPSYQDARFRLIQTILDCDRAIIGAPAAESITDIDDDAAIDLVEEALGLNADDVPEALRVPRQRSQQGPHEIEMIAMVKSYLVQYPDPTPEQRREITSQVQQILMSADKLFPKQHRTGPPKPKPRGKQRAQPKRVPRKKRKK